MRESIILMTKDVPKLKAQRSKRTSDSFKHKIF